MIHAETNELGQIIDAYHSVQEIEVALKRVYGDNARLVLAWLKNRHRGRAIKDIDNPKEAA